MTVGSISRCLLLLLMCAAAVGAQDAQETKEAWRGATLSPRLFLDTDIGIRAELGFLPPSTDFGVSFEVPLRSHIEIQGSASFSPDKKKITDDGHSISASGTGIFWIDSRIGALGEVEYDRLWTSQFDEGGTAPAFGAVIRTRYRYPGRLYISYLIPTGCVWATTSNPCRLQSKRTQGFTIRQEFQFRPYIRWGIEAGAYHFCNQSNPDDPAVPRSCLWAGTELLFVRFQFPGWRRSEPY